MSTNVRKFFANPFAVSELLELIASAPEVDFVHFLTSVRGAQAFSSASKKRCERLAIYLHSSAEQVALLLSLLSSLYQRLRSLELESNDQLSIASEFIEAFLSDTPEENLGSENSPINLEQPNVLSKRLLELLQENHNVLYAEKINRLQNGFIQNAVGFSTFVDLRPNFDEKRTAFSELVAVVQFRIATDNDRNLEREIVFQCNGESLKKLREAVVDAELKLSALANHNLVGKILFDENLG
jgi:hypothetical protein